MVPQDFWWVIILDLNVALVFSSQKSQVLGILSIEIGQLYPLWLDSIYLTAKMLHNVEERAQEELIPTLTSNWTGVDLLNLELPHPGI